MTSLAKGFSGLTDGDEEYVFLADPSHTEWIEPLLSGPCRLAATKKTSTPSLTTKLKTGLGDLLPGARRFWHRVPYVRGARAISIPSSDGTVERMGVDLMHFTSQGAFLTEVPSLYQPWDLQHLHFPEFFTPRVRLAREIIYGAFCRSARLVVTASSGVRADVIQHYRIPEARTAVVAMAPPTSVFPPASPQEAEKLRRRLDLPDRFAYYPAQTFPHKNHIALLEALAQLREHQGIVVRLVCSGHLNDFYPRIARAVKALGLSEQVRFLGFVSPQEVVCLYSLCHCVVFPSRFEGWGNVVTEAFLAERPLACSDISPLREQAGDAAILFDPADRAQVAEAIATLWTDGPLLQRLVDRGKIRVAMFSVDRMVRHFRAHYRRLSGRPLTEEDQVLLTAPPVT